MKNCAIDFEEKAKDVCLHAFERSDSLRSALQSCHGLFPTFAVAQFLSLDRHRTEQWIEQAKSEVQTETVRDFEPAPSFVLSTWSFYSEDLETICSKLVAPTRRTCLLGVPSLARFLVGSDKSRPHVLVDLRTRSTDSSDSVTCLTQDINTLDGGEFPEAFDTCVIDPPWYLENYFKWIELAGEYCREGGTVAFALLGRMTRPSAESDREQILGYCRERGLSLEILENFVLYDTPPFESHMLLRAGIPPVPWKRADLVIATRNNWKASERSIPPVKAVPPLGRVSVSGVQVEIIFDRYDTKSENLVVEPPSGYWMETPSRRVQGLNSCNVFTSNGAKFISPRPIDLYAALRSVESMGGPISQHRAKLLGFPQDVIGVSGAVSREAI